MIRQYEHFNKNKAAVDLLYAGDTLHMALCRYQLSSEDEFFMPCAAITYVHQGQKVIFVNGIKHEMKEGDALFIPKHVILYSDISVEQKPFVSLNTLLRDDALFPGQSSSDPDILGWMACRITDNLQLHHYARSANMSLSAFKRWFRNNMGSSPAQWVIGKRLERARYLLLHKQWSVTAAAFESGFHDVSYFIRRYRQHYGHTPGCEK